MRSYGLALFDSDEEDEDEVDEVDETADKSSRCSELSMLLGMATLTAVLIIVWVHYATRF